MNVCDYRRTDLTCPACGGRHHSTRALVRHLQATVSTRRHADFFSDNGRVEKLRRDTGIDWESIKPLELTSRPGNHPHHGAAGRTTTGTAARNHDPVRAVGRINGHRERERLEHLATRLLGDQTCTGVDMAVAKMRSFMSAAEAEVFVVGMVSAARYATSDARCCRQWWHAQPENTADVVQTSTSNDQHRDDYAQPVLSHVEDVAGRSSARTFTDCRGNNSMEAGEQSSQPFDGSDTKVIEDTDDRPLGPYDSDDQLWHAVMEEMDSLTWSDCEALLSSVDHDVDRATWQAAMYAEILAEFADPPKFTAEASIEDQSMAAHEQSGDDFFIEDVIAWQSGIDESFARLEASAAACYASAEMPPPIGIPHRFL